MVTDRTAATTDNAKIIYEAAVHNLSRSMRPVQTHRDRSQIQAGRLTKSEVESIAFLQYKYDMYASCVTNTSFNNTERTWSLNHTISHAPRDSQQSQSKYVYLTLWGQFETACGRP